MSLGIGKATARTFTSLRRHYNYRLYFFGQVVSISGTWMQTVAQAWFVVQYTHSPIAVGILAVCQFGPYGIFGLFGGAYADRLDQRKVLIGTQAAFMVTAALLAGLTLSGHATVWEIYVLAGVTGMITVLDSPGAHGIHDSDGRTRRAAQCRGAELQPLQRLTHRRSCHRGRPDRRRRGRRLLPDQRAQLPRGARRALVHARGFALPGAQGSARP